MQGLNFNAEKHEYTWLGEKIPSVTEIISPITQDGYAKINPAVLEHAALKGTLVHEWCEMYDYGCAEESVPAEIEGYCKAYIAFCETYNPSWEMIEEEVCMPSEYAGTVDRYGTLNGNENAVVDIKTIQSPSSRTHLSVCCQTAAYMRAITDDPSARRYALYLKADGSFRLFDCREWERKRSFVADDVFQTMLEAWWEVNGILRRGK